MSVCVCDHMFRLKNCLLLCACLEINFGNQLHDEKNILGCEEMVPILPPPGYCIHPNSGEVYCRRQLHPQLSYACRFLV